MNESFLAETALKFKADHPQFIGTVAMTPGKPGETQEIPKETPRGPQARKRARRQIASQARRAELK